MADVTSDVIAIIANKVAPEKRAAIKPGDKLQDLGIESIDSIEMIFEIEEKFGVQVPYNANTASELSTVADVVGAVQKLVDDKPATAGAAE